AYCGATMDAACRAQSNSSIWTGGPRVWGYGELAVFFTGDRVAPNGLLFDPLFNVGLELNFEIISNKTLYAFVDSKFWTQRAASGTTNAGQGKFDFSKRELDFSGGLAWNYFSTLELRASAYSFNNLNRGTSLAVPIGYQDGSFIENRFYFG